MEEDQVNRILWNRRPDPLKGWDRDQDIDEVVLSNVKNVHVEQMNARCWWIGVTLDNDGYWSGNFSSDSRGRMRFTEQEPPTGFEWEDDDTHEHPDPAEDAT
jgi:hypothetical protein